MRPRGSLFIKAMLDFRETDGLLENFEVNREPFWPRISWLIAGSGVWHLVLVACVIMIPAVRDALSLAIMFQGAGFVDKAYKKTQIEDEGDITEITLAKFHYPEGYFAMDQTGMPIEQFPTPAPFTPAPFTPSQVNPVSTPTPFPIATPSPAIAAQVTPTPTPSAEDQKAIEKAEEELDRAAAENGVRRPKEINTRPFKDLLANAKKMKDDGKLKLTGQIELTVESDLEPDGKLKNAHVTDKRGDKILEAVALDFVAALSDSGVLDFLEGTKHLRLVAKIDDNNVEVTAATEVDSESRARQMEKGYSLLIVGGRIAKRGKDEEVYYNHTQVTSQGKEVSVKFAMPRAEMGELLSKYSNEKK